MAKDKKTEDKPVSSPLSENRWGKIIIDSHFLHSSFLDVVIGFAAIKFVPLKVDTNLNQNARIFWGVSPSFKIVPPGSIPYEYQMIFHKTAEGITEFQDLISLPSMDDEHMV